jgi:hypothetical protein
MEKKRRRAAPLAGVAAVVVALPLALALRASGAQPHTGPVLVRAGASGPPARFVRGNGLYDAKGRRAPLAEPVSGALMGPLAPVAVSAPGTSAVAYNSWEPLRQVDPRLSFSKQGIAAGDALGIPSLRVRDAAGRDTLLERGAYSAAWRADGALAYFKAADARFRAGSPYVGDVYVRSGVHGRAVRWSAESARYVVYAWAGDRLLFYRVGEGEALELLVADGPGRVRPLAEGSAVALSPDGTRIIVASPDSTSVRLLDVATGREQAWLDVTTTSTPLRWVGYSGSWSGDEVVAPVSAGFAVFRVEPASLELEQVLSVDRSQFPAGVQEPQFLDGDAHELVATADVPPKDGVGGETYFLDCDRVARTCDRADAAPATEWPRLVRNPSRPGGDR